MKSESLIKKLKSYITKNALREKRIKQKELLNSEFDLLVGPLHAYVCFKDAEYFGSSLFKKGFRHCFIILKTENGWINFHPTRNLFFATISDCGLDDPYVEMIKKYSPDMTIVELVIKNHFSRLLSLHLLTCVTVVKYMLGLKFRPFSAVTPHQLYKKLINKGHPNIFKVREIPPWNQSPLNGHAETPNTRPSKQETRPPDCAKIPASKR